MEDNIGTGVTGCGNQRWLELHQDLVSVAGFGISGGKASGSATSFKHTCINTRVHKGFVNRHLSVAINFDF
jgi:hypothetical protein